MEKAQIRGDVPEEELRALEMDVTGKVRSLLRAAVNTRFGAVAETASLVLK